MSEQLAAASDCCVRWSGSEHYCWCH